MKVINIRQREQEFGLNLHVVSGVNEISIEFAKDELEGFIANLQAILNDFEKEWHMKIEK